MDLKILEEEILACDFCSLRKNLTPIESPIVFRGSGNIMVVTQPPNRDNLESEHHFSVNEQRYFELILKAAEIELEDTYITSVAKCSYGDSNKVNKQCLELCSTKFLLREIRETKPKVILTLGKIPTSHFLSMPLHKLSMSKVVGGQYDYNGIPVMPLYTMSYLIQNGKKKTEEVIKQLSTIKEIKDINGFCK